VKRATGTCKTVGGICTVYDFKAPFIDPYNAGNRVNAADTDYYAFFYSNDAQNPVGLKLFDSDGVLKQVVAEKGRFTAIGDTGFLYVGAAGACGGVPVGCGTGYFFAKSGTIYPELNGNSYSFNIIALDPTLDDILYKYKYDICTDEPKYVSTTTTTTTTSTTTLNINACKIALAKEAADQVPGSDQVIAKGIAVETAKLGILSGLAGNAPSQAPRLFGSLRIPTPPVGFPTPPPLF